MPEHQRSSIYYLAWFLGILASLFFIYILYSQFGRKQEPVVSPMPKEAPAVPAKCPSAMNDEELFLYISDLIRKEKFYLNPMLDRQAQDAYKTGQGSEFTSFGEGGPDPVGRHAQPFDKRLEHASSLQTPRHAPN